MSAIRILSSTAMKTTLDEVLPDFERASAHKAAVTFAPSAKITTLIGGGEPSDVVIVTGQGIEELIGLGKVAAKSRQDLASSVIGVAVRSGAPKPDISTPDQFRRAMLAAKAIATSNPVGGGPSGAHLAKVFAKLGIAEAVKPKLIYGPGGPAGLIGNFVKSGEADIGLQQIPELLAVSGIDVVGPLPDELQSVTVFSIGLSTTAIDSDAAKAFIAFFTGSAATAVMKRKGMKVLK
jgi:molybdate transport system substrate-binding protein